MSERFRPDHWKVTVDTIHSEPVTIDEVLDQLRITADTAENLGQIASLARAARYAVERKTNRAIADQTRTLNLRCFPDAADRFIELPGGSLVSVSAISYRDMAEVTQAFTDFVVDVGSPGRVWAGTAWPSDVSASALPVSITYRAGSSPALDDAKKLILMLCEELYDRPEMSAEKLVEAPAFRYLHENLSMGHVG